MLKNFFFFLYRKWSVNSVSIDFLRRNIFVAAKTIIFHIGNWQDVITKKLTRMGFFLATQVISNELIRNLCLTMGAVITVTLILVADLVTVFWVFTCIAFTLIDLLGLMYYWGLTIEIASSIIVILAAGLAIDYSAHIGHTFTTVHGSKSSNKRNLIRPIICSLNR